MYKKRHMHYKVQTHTRGLQSGSSKCNLFWHILYQTPLSHSWINTDTAHTYTHTHTHTHTKRHTQECPECLYMIKRLKVGQAHSSSSSEITAVPFSPPPTNTHTHTQIQQALCPVSMHGYARTLTQPTEHCFNNWVIPPMKQQGREAHKSQPVIGAGQTRDDNIF